MSNQKLGTSAAAIVIVTNSLNSNQVDILHQTYVRSILREEIKYFVTHVMTNAQLSPAVDAARQVIAKISRRTISTETANVEHSNASSASQADEKGRYALWSSARNSLPKNTYHNDTETGPRSSMYVKHAVRADTV